MASFKLFAVMAILALAGSAAAARKRVTKKDVGFPSVADALIAGNYSSLLAAVEVRRGLLSPRCRLNLGVARRSAGICRSFMSARKQLSGSCFSCASAFLLAGCPVEKHEVPMGSPSATTPLASTPQFLTASPIPAHPCTSSLQLADLTDLFGPEFEGTVLAPVNKAFEQLIEEVTPLGLEGALEDPAIVAQVLVSRHQVAIYKMAPLLQPLCFGRFE